MLSVFQHVNFFTLKIRQDKVNLNIFDLFESLRISLHNNLPDHDIIGLSMHVTTASLLSSSGHRHLPPPAPLHVTEDPHPARETQEAGLLHAHDRKVRPQTLCQHPETRHTHQKCLLAP